MFPLFIDYFLILWQKNPTKTKKTGCSRIILYFLCLSPEMTISLGTCLYSPQSCLQIVFTNENYMIRIHLFLNFSIGILTNDKNSSQVNIFSSVQFSCSVVSDSLWPHEPWHAKPPCPSPTPGVHPNPCPLSWWCHLTISSSVVPFFSCPQSFPASGSFQMSQLFISGGQSIGVSASASVLPMNTQDWSPLGWIGWISLQSKGLSRVFSNTTVQKHQLFNTQLSLESNSHIHTWPLEKP